MGSQAAQSSGRATGFPLRAESPLKRTHQNPVHRLVSRPSAWEARSRASRTDQASDFPSLHQASTSAPAPRPNLVVPSALPAVVKPEDIPESWEELQPDDDLTTAVVAAVPDADHPGAMEEHVDPADLAALGSMAKVSCHTCGHSRFKKDLTNLNKATVKWLKQHSEGHIDLADVVGRIRSSPAAKHLREMHGEEFRQEEFVEEVIARARHAK